MMCHNLCQRIIYVSTQCHESFVICIGIQFVCALRFSLTLSQMWLALVVRATLPLKITDSAVGGARGDVWSTMRVTDSGGCVEHHASY